MGKKTRKPVVSVILPVYNGAGFIGPAVESVLSQSFADLELIVVDDGSTDATVTVLERYVTQDERVRVIKQANDGVARARNRGIQEAQGEFVAPLDADDLWEPTKIDRQVKRMIEGGPDLGFVYCWWVWIDEEDCILDRSPHWLIEGDVFARLVQINFTGNASVPLFRRECLLEINCYNPDMADAHAGGCEDWEVALKIAAKYKVAVVPEILVGYRRRVGSMSTACKTMLRSHQLLVQTVCQLKPNLNHAFIKRAEQQYSLYLAGVSLWSGSLSNAIRFGLRAGWSLSLSVAPHILKMILGRSRKAQYGQMKPGASLTEEAVPKKPLLPYDEIYERVGLEW
jgi:glycosyltransferase involved in cell wall biosynthesis